MLMPRRTKNSMVTLCLSMRWVEWYKYLNNLFLGLQIFQKVTMSKWEILWNDICTFVLTIEHRLCVQQIKTHNFWQYTQIFQVLTQVLNIWTLRCIGKQNWHGLSGLLYITSFFSRLVFQTNVLNLFYMRKTMTYPGFEPGTFGFQVGNVTNWAMEAVIR
jgi:hypothetical protein